MDTTSFSSASPLIGIGFRIPIAKWTLANLHRFDVLEITVDHYIKGGEYARKAIRNLVDRIPLVLHGVGLSIGTDAPLDETYLDGVAEAIEDLKVPSYSEHLAWTKVPGIDIANLLPLPKTRAAADMLIPKIERVQARLPVPFSIENISYVFDFPHGEMSDAEFFNLLFRETGVGMLLDVENLFVNSKNHGIDPHGFSGPTASGCGDRCPRGRRTVDSPALSRRAVPCRQPQPPGTGAGTGAVGARPSPATAGDRDPGARQRLRTGRRSIGGRGASPPANTTNRHEREVRKPCTDSLTHRPACCVI